MGELWPGMRIYAVVMNTENPAAGIRGRPLDVEPTDELEFYELCPECGQAFDLRNLSEVLYHDEQGHDPLPTH